MRARIYALAVLRISRQRPYQCPVCNNASIIPSSNGMRIVLGWVVAIGASVAVLDYFQLPRVVLFLNCAGAVALFPLIFARLCRFEPKV